MSERRPFAFIQQAAEGRSVVLHATNAFSCIHCRKFRIKSEWGSGDGRGEFEKSAGKGIFSEIHFLCFKYIHAMRNSEKFHCALI